MAKIANFLSDNPIVTLFTFIFCCSCLYSQFCFVWCEADDDTFEYKLDVDDFAVQNRRKHMEDRYFIDVRIEGTDVGLFGVFDGHGGEYVSFKAQSQLMPRIRDKIRQIYQIKESNDTAAEPRTEVAEFSAEYYIEKYGDDDNGLVLAFKQLLHDEIMYFDDEMQLVDENMYCGSTAVIAIVTQRRLIVANVGDSRAILGNTSNEAIRITKDHKPDDKVERARIESVEHGRVTQQPMDVPRVNNILAMSRALGDTALKIRNFIIATPDIFVIDLKQSKFKPKHLVIASDGIWDVLGDQDVIKAINQYAYGGEVARRIARDAIMSESYDNIAILIISFRQVATATVDDNLAEDKIDGDGDNFDLFVDTGRDDVSPEPLVEDRDEL